MQLACRLALLSLDERTVDEVKAILVTASRAAAFETPSDATDIQPVDRMRGVNDRAAREAHRALHSRLLLSC